MTHPKMLISEINQLIKTAPSEGQVQSPPNALYRGNHFFLTRCRAMTADSQRPPHLNNQRLPHLKRIAMLALLLLSVGYSSFSFAHHVLGRPAYSLSEDSTTPPSMQAEVNVGDFSITYMVFPAFPKPNQQGRVNLYINHIISGEVYNGEVAFRVHDVGWFSDKETELLGTQTLDDGVYRQSFIFQNNGDYTISTQFEADGEPYTIDFPLTIGQKSMLGPIGGIMAFLLLSLIAANVFFRRRLQRSKMQLARRSS